MDGEGNIFKGLLWGGLLSIPLWGGIIFLIRQLFT